MAFGLSSNINTIVLGDGVEDIGVELSAWVLRIFDFGFENAVVFGASVGAFGQEMRLD